MRCMYKNVRTLGNYQKLNESLPIYDGNADLTFPRLQPLYPLLGTQHQYQANEQDSHHQNLLLKSTNVYIIYKLHAIDIILWCFQGIK